MRISTEYFQLKVNIYPLPSLLRPYAIPAYGGLISMAALPKGVRIPKPLIPVRVVFLDIDGVLLPFSGGSKAALPYEVVDFSRESLSALAEILSVPRTEVVLSSTWRVSEAGIEAIYRNFRTHEALKKVRFKHWNRTDPNFHSTRAEEIQRWLEQVPQAFGLSVESYIILDDESVADTFPGKSILTRSPVGLLQSDVATAVDILKNSTNSMLKSMHTARMARRKVKTETFTIEGKPGYNDGPPLRVRVCTLPGSCIGSIVWPGASCMSTFLFHHTSFFVRAGIDAIELGSGCGLVGLSYALCGGKIIMTETPSAGKLLTLLKKSVVMNENEVSQAGGSVSVIPYIWGNLWSGSSPSFVFASDCLYSEECVEPLFKTISVELIPPSNISTVFFLAYRPREKKAEDRFFEYLREEGFFIDRVVEEAESTGGPKTCPGSVSAKVDFIYIISRTTSHGGWFKYSSTTVPSDIAL